LSTLSFHQCYRSSAFASQNVGRLRSMPGFRHFSTHAATEKKSQKMLMYLTGLVFGMVGLSYAAVPLYRRFCQATGYGGTVTRREVCVTLFSPVFHFLVRVIGNLFFICWLLFANFTFLQSVEEKIARHDSNQTVTSRCYFYPLDVIFLPMVCDRIIFYLFFLRVDECVIIWNWSISNRHTHKQWAFMYIIAANSGR